MPFHVRITPKTEPKYDEVRLDLSQDDLEARILNPYKEGRPIVIGGRTIPPDEIGRIRITFTEQPSERVLPIVRAEREASSVMTFISDEWYVADHGEDVTEDFITQPPGTGVTKRDAPQGPDIEGPAVVFVVHGRNRKLRDAMFDFLRSIALHPLEWTEAVAATGKASPYIGEILDAAFAIAQAIVVLMTPDDEAVLREPLRERGDPVHETSLTPQARPNVIFEAGMAMGRSPDRTVIVEIGNLRPFSDVAGRHTVRLNNSTQRRQELGRRLQTAGCPVNMAGSAWHSAGDFSVDE